MSASDTELASLPSSEGFPSMLWSSAWVSEILRVRTGLNLETDSPGLWTALHSLIRQAWIWVELICSFGEMILSKIQYPPREGSFSQSTGTKSKQCGDRVTCPLNSKFQCNAVDIVNLGFQNS